MAHRKMIMRAAVKNGSQWIENRLILLENSNSKVIKSELEMTFYSCSFVSIGIIRDNKFDEVESGWYRLYLYKNLSTSKRAWRKTDQNRLEKIETFHSRVFLPNLSNVEWFILRQDKKNRKSYSRISLSDSAIFKIETNVERWLRPKCFFWPPNELLLSKWKSRNGTLLR